MVILLCQDGQLTGLLILQPLQHGLVVRLGRVLQQVVAQRLVLTGLDLAGVLELTLYLQLFGLEERGERRRQLGSSAPVALEQWALAQRCRGKNLTFLDLNVLCICAIT